MNNRPLPKIEVVDLRESRQQRRDSAEPLPFWLSRPLFDELEQTLKRGDQAALFLNRRGVAQLALCGDCGYTYECPNCAISLTLHSARDLVCHYCDYTQRLSEKCPQCSSIEIRPLGLGTELVESDIAKLFPAARLARADRDEIQSRREMEQFINQVERREIDVLIGTQMIAKGLDFPGLTLVGIVLADVGFNLPDFRASERSFQLLTQVSGRSGRHTDTPGKVLIQTYNPEHPAIQFTLAHDLPGFFRQELDSREHLMYPPFGRLALVRLQGTTYDRAHLAAQILQRRAQSLAYSHDRYQSIGFLGPAPAPLAKLRGKYRFQALVKSADPKTLNAFCTQLSGDRSWLPAGVKLQLDVDPINML